MAPHFPDPADPYEDAGLPGTDDALPGKLITGDVQDDVVVPTDHATYVNAYGTTDREEALGEPLGMKLAEEEPDVLSHIDDPWSDDSGGASDQVGRLVAEDEGAHEDDDAELYAGDLGTDSGGFSAEESAMHLEPDTDS